jgi:hypothetical protein
MTEEELELRVIICPMSHRIIVSSGFPFEYKGVKCHTCKKEYYITPKGRIRYEKGKFVSRDIVE